MRRREFIAGAAMLAGMTQAQAFGLGRLGKLGSTNAGMAAAMVNINATTTANFKAAYIANSANIPVAFNGDSTMRGVDETALPYNSQYPNSGAQDLAALLNAAGINAGSNNWYGHSGVSLADYTTRDSRVAAAGGTIVGSVQCQGGSSINFPTATSSWSFTTASPCTTADIYWRDSSTTSRIFSWEVDGGAATQVPNSGATAFGKTTIALGAQATHTITLRWVGGSVDIYGIDCYDATAGRKEITVRQWAASGATSATLVGNTGAPNGGRLAQLAAFPVKLLIAEAGPNDWRTSVSVAAFKANMLTLINAQKATGGDIWLMVPPFDGGSTGLVANQNAYVAAMYELSASENVGLLDIRKLWLSYAYEQAQGLVGVGDFIHPTKLKGYPAQAQLIYSAIRKVIG